MGRSFNRSGKRPYQRARRYSSNQLPRRHRTRLLDMEDSALQDSQALLLHSQLGRAIRLFSEVLGITALEACRLSWVCLVRLYQRHLKARKLERRQLGRGRRRVRIARGESGSDKILVPSRSACVSSNQQSITRFDRLVLCPMRHR